MSTDQNVTILTPHYPLLDETVRWIVADCVPLPRIPEAHRQIMRRAQRLLAEGILTRRGQEMQALLYLMCLHKHFNRRIEEEANKELLGALNLLNMPAATEQRQ